MNDPEVVHGSVHNMLLAQSRDSAAAARDMPSLMVSMLRENGWRVLVRPKDGKRFEHKVIDDWVLGPAWAGLYWPNWETLYGVLRANPKDGEEAIRLLVAAGAPEPKVVDKKMAVAQAKEQKDLADKNMLGGTPVENLHRVPRDSGSTAHILRRLARTSPETLSAFERGEFKSVAAAARAAGIENRKCPVTIIRRAWKNANPDERREIATWINEQAQEMGR